MAPTARDKELPSVSFSIAKDCININNTAILSLERISQQRCGWTGVLHSLPQLDSDIRLFFMVRSESSNVHTFSDCSLSDFKSAVVIHLCD